MSKEADRKGLKLLNELLAAIHEDGGHYAHYHGLDKATEDAIKKYYGLRAKVAPPTEKA